jgi:hypothetical protein
MMSRETRLSEYRLSGLHYQAPGLINKLRFVRSSDGQRLLRLLVPRSLTVRCW